jgi:glyoxylase-like metal-dependent hydrolase (beta-lactamase superfamily II)
VKRYELSNVAKIAGDIYKIDAQFAEGDRPSISYLIAGNPAALIDNGPASTIPAMLEALRQIGQDPKQIAYILPTHIHLDHAGGAGKLTKLWPWTQVVFHEQGVRHMTDPTKLIASTKKAFGDNFEDIFGPILPVAESQVKVVKGGETLLLGKRELQIIYSPGHAPHHICFLQSHDRSLFCGEALGLPWGETENVITAAIPPGFDLELTFDTYDKLEKLAPSILIYAHDGVSRDVKKRIQTVRVITQRSGDVILAGLKSGKDSMEVCRLVEKRLADDGFSGVAGQLASMVDGFIFYYKKRGI